MKMKPYIAPATETINMSIYDNVLDWVITSFDDGDGDVDAKLGFLDDEEEDVDAYFYVGVWQ